MRALISMRLTSFSVSEIITSAIMTASPRYMIVTEWSDEDQAYGVILPEWEDRYAMPVASGVTYEDAAA